MGSAQRSSAAWILALFLCVALAAGQDISDGQVADDQLGLEEEELWGADLEPTTVLVDGVLVSDSRRSCNEPREYPPGSCSAGSSGGRCRGACTGVSSGGPPVTREQFCAEIPDPRINDCP